MHKELHAILSSLGGNFQAGSDVVDDFGNRAAELQAAASGGAMADLSHLAVMSIHGVDATTFLHGQFSCDVAGLPAGHATYGSYCTAKGRMLATFLLWQQADGWRLLLPRSIAPAIQKRLKMYVLRAKVSIDELSESLALIGCVGPSCIPAAENIGITLPANAMQVLEAGAASAVATTAIAIPGNRWIICLPAEQAGAVWLPLAEKLQPIGARAWTWTDIRNGVPHLTQPTQEQFVPQMANLEAIGGVSFKKGCYPGQEIVARTQYLGKTKRRMYLAHAASAAAAGDPVYSDDVAGQSNGMVVDAQAAPGGGFDLLVVVQTDSAAQSTVHLVSPDGPTLEFGTLPYPVS